MVRVRFEQIVKHYDSLEGVTLTGYKGLPALDQIDLTIEDGETMSIVGPSGCGKSTILKVVSGLEYPNKGKIFYDTFDMTNIKPQDRGVGMVFQDYALYPSMKGKGNLAYYFEQHQTSQEDQDRRVRETAELMGVGFETLLGRLPDTLSGGEKQRVADSLQMREMARAGLRAQASGIGAILADNGEKRHIRALLSGLGGLTPRRFSTRDADFPINRFFSGRRSCRASAS